MLLALARGDADAGALAADGGTGTLLLLLPGLVTFVCAVACARLLGPGLRLLERVSRGSSPPVRLASLSLARSPGRAAVAVTFLVVSLGLGLFAALYRSTLGDGLAEQAAYAVPLDFRVRTDLTPSGLVAPLDAAPLERYDELGADVVPVIRQTGTAAGAGQATLLGVPAGTLPEGDRLPADAEVSLAGPELPEDASELQLPVSVRGGNVALTAIVLAPGGRFARLPLGQTQGTNEVVLSAAVPPEARGGRIVAISLARPDAVTGHGEFGERVDGRLTLGALRADGEPILAGYDDWTGLDGVQAEDGRPSLPAHERGRESALPAAPADGRRTRARRRHAPARGARRRRRRAARARRVGPDLGSRGRRGRPRPDRLGRRHPRRREHALRRAQLGEPGNDACRTSCGSPGRSRWEPRSSARRSTSST